MEWIKLAKDRYWWPAIVNAVMNLLVPYNVGIILTSCKPVSFLRRTIFHGVSKLVINAVLLNGIEIISVSELPPFLSYRQLPCLGLPHYGLSLVYCR